MTRSRPIGLLVSAAVIALVALTFAAGAHVATAGVTHPTVAIEPSVNAASVTRNSPRPTVQVRRTGLGQILVDSRGRTLYLFKKDTRGHSSCSGSCAANWPPLLVTGKPRAGTGVKASKLTTTRRSDGATQVVYNRHPLYRFIADAKPGDTNGEGLSAFGARWFVVSPTGTPVT
jgi:predicted lipoprotein with Yx(FWY)xxD motif